MKPVIRTERGWAGHFICSDSCKFRRNTLLECDDVRIVVSTVGAMMLPSKTVFELIGYRRYYETMAFHAHREGIYWDADVLRQVSFNSSWAVDKMSDDSDQKANDMHEVVVAEISERLSAGDTFPGDAR